jgi:hypothetical protein
MGGGLLVAEVDDPDALVDRTVVDRCDVPAGEREQMADALTLQGGSGQMATVPGLVHAGSSFPPHRTRRVAARVTPSA